MRLAVFHEQALVDDQALATARVALNALTGMGLERIARVVQGVEPGAMRELWKGFRGGRLHWSRAWASAGSDCTAA